MLFYFSAALNLLPSFERKDCKFILLHLFHAYGPEM